MLSVAFGLGGEVCYSGSSDSTIRVWRVPEESEDDPFSVYGEGGGHLLEIWSCKFLAGLYMPSSGLVEYYGIIKQPVSYQHKLVIK